MHDFPLQRTGQTYDCNSPKPIGYPALSLEQRLSAGSIILSAGCLDLAGRILPEFTASSGRADLLAFRWGQVAWERGDQNEAARLWQQYRDISPFFTLQAQQFQKTDLLEAMQWHEAAILSAGTDWSLAEALWAYTDGMRGKVEPKVFNERLDALTAYFGPDTAVGHRLEGQRLMGEGNLQAAFSALSQAVDLGLTDSETWHLLGYTAWKLDDVEMAEYAFRQSLDAAIQVSERRAWYLYQMAALLAERGQIAEAVVFQEEAARSNDYYLYHDVLAVLYARLGQPDKARVACSKARKLAGQGVIVLQCEK